MNSKFVKFWTLYLIIAGLIVYAAVLYTNSLDKEADHKETVEYLAIEANTARTNSELQAKQDGFIVHYALAAAMASAENYIADIEAGSLLDCIDATCRVSTVTGKSSYSMGTGVVFKITDDEVLVITNAHVATTKTMKLEFWREGHKLPAITGTTTIRDSKRDVAVISVDINKFKDHLPGFIPLAARGTTLKDGQKIMSAGSPKGTWTRAWVGHVENTHNGRVAFQPGPYGGQSGSGIFNGEGTEIVALLNLQETYGDNSGRIIRGYAVTLENIYLAIYGKETVEEARWRPWQSDQAWQRYQSKGQCGPGGCPPRGCDPGSEQPTPAPVDDLEPVVPFVLPEPKPIVFEIVPIVVEGPSDEIISELFPSTDPPEGCECSPEGCVVAPVDVNKSGFSLVKYLVSVFYSCLVAVALIYAALVIVKLCRK